MVPANRRVASVFPDSNVRENLTVANLGTLSRGRLIRRRAERAEGRGRGSTPCRFGRLTVSRSIPTRWRGQSAEGAARPLAPPPAPDPDPRRADARSRRRHEAGDLRLAAPAPRPKEPASSCAPRTARVTSRLRIGSSCWASGLVGAELRGTSLTLDRLNHEIVAA